MGSNEASRRLRTGLKAIAPGMARGALTGSAAALLLPSAISLSCLGIEKLSTFTSTNLGQSLQPWLKAVVAPDHSLPMALTAAIALLFLAREALWQFLKRTYSWAIYEPTLLWAVGSLVIWTQSRWMSAATSVATLSLSCLIAWRRTAPPGKMEAIFNPDQPIQRATEDKLGRGPVVTSLVSRLLTDGAPVIALVGAYGDGKTSILSLLSEALRTQNAIVVNFKTSLPGDELTLASTLFNSLEKQLRQRFFVRGLARTLKKLARNFSGLVPSAPSGLKDLFAEPSQEAELTELTRRLDDLPIRRVVVLLDDMDRMQANELRTLLKIIRAADAYPKLSFVCAFNKRALVDVLVRHQIIDRITLRLSATGPGSIQGDLSGEITADDTRAGYEYLEKFFPVQVPVPKLDDAQLAKEFDIRFNRFAESNGLPSAEEETAKFDKEFNPYWKPLFRPVLSNLRKMNSYFNALNASFTLVKGEVNVIDFMFVELLRQLDPEMYEQVFRNRALFYYPEWDLQRWDERHVLTRDDRKEEERLNRTYDEIFMRRQGVDREIVLLLLSRLFPKVAKYHKARPLTSGGMPNELEADLQKRIYHPYYFLIYFSLHVEDGYLGAEELEKIIKDANQINGANLAEPFFAAYLRGLKPLKRYRFFEKMGRSEERLAGTQARALAAAVASVANKLEYDELDLGEFAAATNLVLMLANRFKDTREITDILKDIILRSTTEAFASRILGFAVARDRNKIFDNWDNVQTDELESAFLQRLRGRYHKGGHESIYSSGTNFRDWYALIWWSRRSDRDAEDVRSYLGEEFALRPSSIGKHIHWLWSTIGEPEGTNLVNRLFPLRELAQLAKNKGAAAYSTPSEKKSVDKLIEEYGKTEG